MDVRIPVGTARLEGVLALPVAPRGVVAFSHGSGSGRHSPRNRFVAAELRRAGLATLLLDLLTEEEDLERDNRFDIELLSGRLAHAVRFLAGEKATRGLPVGLFGASTGAAAALDAAAARPALVNAVVSRGGRPDLAKDLRIVRAPVLLIVGGEDVDVLQMNSDALAQLTCTKELEVVPGATHLFEEPGALEAVASAAGAWFQQYLRGTKGTAL